MNNETKLSDLTVGEFREPMRECMQVDDGEGIEGELAPEGADLPVGNNGSLKSTNVHPAWCMCLQCRYKNY